MHKELIICIIIILIVVTTNAIIQNYTKDSVKVMDENLDKLEQALKKDEKDEEELQKNLEMVMEKWRERYEVLAFFIEHDELEKVETELTSLNAEIGVEEYEQAVSSLERSIFILNHIKEKFKLNMKNIF